MKQTEYLFDPEKEEFPSLLASVNVSKNKKGSNSARQTNKCPLPSGFQKKHFPSHSDRSRLDRIVSEQGDGLKFSEDSNYKTFNIRLPESSKQISSLSSGFLQKHLKSHSDRSRLTRIIPEHVEDLNSWDSN